MPTRTFIDAGDTLRLTRDLVRAFYQAMTRGDDHLVIRSIERNLKTGEVKLELEPAPRVEETDHGYGHGV